MKEQSYTVEDSLILDGDTTLVALPAESNIEGDLSLQHCTSLHRLPEKLYVGLNLDISYSSVERFPEFFSVEADIIGSHSNLRSIASLERTQMSLLLSHCEALEEMPDMLIVNGDLDLSYCTRLAQLPRKLIVRGNLYLQHTQVITLPEFLLVGGDLCLSGTPISGLPSHLLVGGYLDLSGCAQLTTLPDQLQVRTFLNLFQSGIGSFTEANDLQVGGVIVNQSGSLIINKNGKMEAIPNLTNDLSADYLLQQSRVTLDAVFMGKGHFVSYNNELWRIIFSRNDIYIVEDLCLSAGYGDAHILYKGDDGHFVLQYLSNMPTDEFSEEWFGEAFPRY